jgi:hypothetical protein
MKTKFTAAVIILLIMSVFSSCSIGKQSQSDISSEENTILVLIKKEYSEFGKEYSPADFDAELIKSVEVINQINPGDDTSGYNLEYWQQILLLELKNPTEENVQKAIEAAYRNPQVESAAENVTIEYDLCLSPDEENSQQ